jgi:hypothetical protein
LICMPECDFYSFIAFTSFNLKSCLKKMR